MAFAHAEIVQSFYEATHPVVSHSIPVSLLIGKGWQIEGRGQRPRRMTLRRAITEILQSYPAGVFVSAYTLQVGLVTRGIVIAIRPIQTSLGIMFSQHRLVRIGLRGQTRYAVRRA